MARKSQKRSNEKELKVKLEDSPVSFSMYFNSFRILRDKDLVFLSFAYIQGTTLLNAYSCAMSVASIHSQKETLLSYLSRTGMSELQAGDICKSNESLAISAMNVIDVIGASHMNGTAEFILTQYSLRAALTENSAKAYPVALLRTSVNVQGSFILNILEYAD